ncbi:MAG: DUF3109 family protein [Ignavibacteriaceae bacterium]|nr:DUF3109 family protein [Ignavibacteriaceae bacterium]
MYRGSDIIVKDVFLRAELIDTKFACNLVQCKGACCTLESEYGAPLLEDEINQIHGSLEAAKKYLPKSHIQKIDKAGFFEKKNNELLVSSIDNKACIFAFFEDGIAKCSLEKAYNNGESEFPKPISCHLFPIRVGNFGGDVLRFEEFSECLPALENGKNKNINVIDFCKDALIRRYGKNWYSQLKEKIGK